MAHPQAQHACLQMFLFRRQNYLTNHRSQSRLPHTEFRDITRARSLYAPYFAPKSERDRLLAWGERREVRRWEIAPACSRLYGSGCVQLFLSRWALPGIVKQNRRADNFKMEENRDAKGQRCLSRLRGGDFQDIYCGSDFSERVFRTDRVKTKTRRHFLVPIQRKGRLVRGLQRDTRRWRRREI